MNDDWHPLPRYLLRKSVIKKLFKNLPTHGKQCLELGYGSGDMLMFFAKKGMIPFGYDFSQLAFENASNRIKEAKLDGVISLIKTEKEITSRVYDYIFAFEVLEHIENDWDALKYWIGMLKSDGKLILSVPAHMKKWNISDASVGHYRRYEKEDIFKLARDNGMFCQLIWSYGFPLNLILDNLLEGAMKEEFNQSADIKKEDLSKTSGIKRKKNFLIKLFSRDLFLFPFYYLQNLFLTRDFGSGYVFVFKKMCKKV